MTYRALTLVLATLLPATALAETDAGAYLAGRVAGAHANFPEAAPYFRSALMSDPRNPLLMEQALTSYMGAGEVETAASISRNLIAAGQESQVANMALMAQSAAAGDWATVQADLDAGHVVAPLIDGLAQGWAAYGQGDMERALTLFDEVAATQGLRAFGLQHKAFALTMADRLDEAKAIYDLAPEEGIPPNRWSIRFQMALLCQLGQFEEAETLYQQAYGANPATSLIELRDAIAERRVPNLSEAISTPAKGLAFGFQTLAEALNGDANDVYLLMYAQAARHMDPDNAAAHMTAAQFLNEIERHDEAAQLFARVAPDHPFFYDAELGRAESLRRAGRLDQAIEVLTQLNRSYPNLPQAVSSLGDLYRQTESYPEASAAYETAMGLYPEGAQILWWLHYARGMTFERMDEWDAAEADFRAALALNPDHPAVLNYLGYSLVDRGLKYDEALGMIEKAAAARPESGAIVDSLAWVYFKLGRYEDAVDPMERAARLEPNDPILSDHLGDVYWMVGREVEARFQWRRALSFGPEEDEADRIREKLRIGLDAVYDAEGITPAPAVPPQ